VLSGAGNPGPASVVFPLMGLWIAIAAVAAGLLFGGFRLVTDGRFRASTRSDAERVATEAEPLATSTPTAVELLPAGTELGEHATLVQFSSAFCAPCRTTRQVLADVAGRMPGVVHVEIDAESHLDTVRALDILRTPTTLILDREGREIARAAGAPRPDQVIAALPSR
jgi:thiol-disulfide isomerase/thioredoxin